MKRADNIQNELQSLGFETIAGLSNTMPYAVPTGYFESFQQNIAICVQNEQEVITNIPKMLNTTVGYVPDGYFEGFAAQILNKIKDNDAVIWTKENPYQIPAGYFENLPARIIANIHNAPQKAIPSRIPIYRTVQLAASLALVFFVGLGIFQTNNHQKSLINNVAEISDAEIAKYINDNIDDFDTDIVLNGLSFKKISEQNTSEISNITKDEINQYMAEEGLN